MGAQARRGGRRAGERDEVDAGIGGQVDFVRGAARSRGGKAIIALRSTAKGGTVSRIQADWPGFDPGTVHTVVLVSALGIWLWDTFEGWWRTTS